MSPAPAIVMSGMLIFEVPIVEGGFSWYRLSVMRVAFGGMPHFKLFRHRSEKYEADGPASCIDCTLCCADLSIDVGVRLAVRRLAGFAFVRDHREDLSQRAYPCGAFCITLIPLHA